MKITEIKKLLNDTNLSKDTDNNFHTVQSRTSGKNVCRNEKFGNRLIEVGKLLISAGKEILKKV